MEEGLRSLDDLDPLLEGGVSRKKKSGCSESSQRQKSLEGQALISLNSQPSPVRCRRRRTKSLCLAKQSLDMSDPANHPI